MLIEWAESAAQDLLSILAYIREDTGKEIAEKVAGRLMSATNRLESFPLSGRAGLVPDTRELVVPNLPYFIIYKVTEEKVRIIRVMHTSRLWQPE